jgi:hypothetical protein
MSTEKEDDRKRFILLGQVRVLPGQVVVEDSAHPALSRESIGTRFPAIMRTASVFQAEHFVDSLQLE